MLANPLLLLPLPLLLPQSQLQPPQAKNGNKMKTEKEKTIRQQRKNKRIHLRVWKKIQDPKRQRERRRKREARRRRRGARRGRRESGIRHKDPLHCWQDPTSRLDEMLSFRSKNASTNASLRVWRSC